MSAVALPRFAFPRLARWPLSVAGQIADSYRLGASMLWACPAIAALAVLPEAAQHVAEIQMGMFAAGDTIDPGRETGIRLVFGAVKVAGLLLCILLTLRFRLVGSDLRRTFTPNLPGLGRFLLAFAVIGLIDLTAPYASTDNLRYDLGAAGRSVDIALDVLRYGAQALLLLWLIGAVGGDRTMTMRRSARLGIRNVARAFILVPAAFLPIAMLHQQMHVWAKGSEPAIVWGLMGADSLLVGLLATITGTTFYVFYRDASAAVRP